MAKILVADDNSNIQKMVGLALKDQGIDVVAVGNGEAAVRKIADLKPDLVLADVFMPVRNGYEVCKFVKDDPALAHIPVILLVGAFDPLDEQEAQRVGADGVLKKPFVPPDPLISMVKSALARAGVSLGNAPVVERAPEAPKRNAAELLSPAVSKLAALSSAKLPEAEPEEVPEDFPAMPSQVRIAAGQEPVAFGSLLETPEAEDDAAFVPAKPPTELGSVQNWAAEEDEESVDVEEEESGNGWRPGGDLTALEPDEAAIENKVKDWREEAFHGSSPARAHRSQRWAPAVADVEAAESTGSRAVAVTTLEPKIAEAPAFSGDAWAAAMAAGVEEKLADPQALNLPAEPLATTEVTPAAETKIESAHQAQTLSAPTETKPDNGWYSVTSSPWEVEAKKATLLASTWDTAKIDEPVATSEPVATESASAYAAEPIADIAESTKEFAQESRVEEAPTQLHEVTFETTSEAPAPSAYVAESHVNETQEIESYQPAASQSWESTFVAAPPEVVSQFVETPTPEFVAEQDEPVSIAPQEPVRAAEEASATTQAPALAPNMDELVARVLSRMSPEVLQKVTQDILKPVIAALIQDELNGKM